MRKLHLTAIVPFVLLVSATVAFAATKASYVPPAEPGLIYTVINFDRAQGRVRATYVDVDFGGVRRRVLVPTPYSANPCATTTPSGFVFRLRHNQPDSPLLQLSTTGTVVRGPYQGEPPLELLSACYKLVK